MGINAEDLPSWPRVDSWINIAKLSVGPKLLDSECRQARKARFQAGTVGLSNAIYGASNVEPVLFRNREGDD
eukprot:150280-Prymnesium_polylepis.1